jgi:hypothetical protein
MTDHDEGIAYGELGVDALLELCEQGDTRACALLDERGVKRPELDLIAPEADPIYGDSDVPGLCGNCGDSIGVHDRETLACPRRVAA